MFLCHKVIFQVKFYENMSFELFRSINIPKNIVSMYNIKKLFFILHTTLLLDVVTYV